MDTKEGVINGSCPFWNIICLLHGYIINFLQVLGVDGITPIGIAEIARNPPIPNSMSIPLSIDIPGYSGARRVYKKGG